MTAETLTFSQKRTFKNIRNAAEIVTPQMGDVSIALLGLSGVGKSRILEELAQLFPVQEQEEEIGVFSINGIQLPIYTLTLRSEFFSHDGAVDITRLEDPSRETMFLTQRSLSFEEAAVLVDQTQTNLDRQKLNIYTLGIPKLIFQSRNLKSVSAVIRMTASYLSQYIQNLPSEVIAPVLQNIQDNFLAEDRILPEEILELLYSQASSDNPFQRMYKQLIPSAGEQESPNDIFLINALESMNPVSRAHYAQSYEELRDFPSTTYRIEAWFEEPDEEQTQQLLMELSKTYPDFSGERFGSLGRLLSLFSLRHSFIGYESQSIFGGGHTKAKFSLRIGNERTGLSIFNCTDTTFTDQVGGSNVSSPYVLQFMKAKYRSTQGVPNLVLESHDHTINGPASQMVLQEAALQQLNIPYRISRPDGKSFIFDPSRETVYYEHRDSRSSITKKKR